MLGFSASVISRIATSGFTTRDEAEGAAAADAAELAAAALFAGRAACESFATAAAAPVFREFARLIVRVYRSYVVLALNVLLDRVIGCRSHTGTHSQSRCTCSDAQQVTHTH